MLVFLPPSAMAVQDGVWRHAARLGYAWRQLRKDTSLMADSSAEIIFDLQAETLQRLGLRLRPPRGATTAEALAHARSDVFLAVDKLAALATRSCSDGTQVPSRNVACAPRGRSLGMAPTRIPRSSRSGRRRRSRARGHNLPAMRGVQEVVPNLPKVDTRLFDFDALDVLDCAIVTQDETLVVDEASGLGVPRDRSRGMAPSHPLPCLVDVSTMTDLVVKDNNSSQTVHSSCDTSASCDVQFTGSDNRCELELGVPWDRSCGTAPSQSMLHASGVHLDRSCGTAPTRSVPAMAPRTLWLHYLLPIVIPDGPKPTPRILQNIRQLRCAVHQEQVGPLIRRRDRLLLMLDCDVSFLVDEIAIMKVVNEPVVPTRASRRSSRRADQRERFLRAQLDRSAMDDIIAADLEKTMPICDHFRRLLFAGVFDDWNDLDESYEDIDRPAGIHYHPMFERFVEEFYPDDTYMLDWDLGEDELVENVDGGCRIGDSQEDDAFWEFLEACQSSPPNDDDDW